MYPTTVFAALLLAAPVLGAVFPADAPAADVLARDEAKEKPTKTAILPPKPTVTVTKSLPPKPTKTHSPKPSGDKTTLTKSIRTRTRTRTRTKPTVAPPKPTDEAPEKPTVAPPKPTGKGKTTTVKVPPTGRPTVTPILTVPVPPKPTKPVA